MSPARLLGLLALFALAALLLALDWGSHPDGLRQWLDGDPLARTLVLELRLPRALGAFAVGGLLALAGVVMQVLLRNPLGDPYVLGVSGGAGLGALLALWWALPAAWTAAAACAGALVSMLLVFALAARGGWGATRLLLTGVILASGWTALLTLVLALAPAARLPGMLFWLMGDLSDPGDTGPAWGVLLGGLALALPLARPLDLLLRGEAQAAVLGVDVSRLHRGLFLLGSLLTAAAVTQAGGIGFVGLVVPHLARLAGATAHRLLIPAAVLLGGGLLVLADTLARTLLAPRQLPVGVITAGLGVPLFLWLLNRRPRP